MKRCIEICQEHGVRIEFYRLRTKDSEKNWETEQMHAEVRFWTDKIQSNTEEFKQRAKFKAEILQGCLIFLPNELDAQPMIVTHVVQAVSDNSSALLALRHLTESELEEYNTESQIDKEQEAKATEQEETTYRLDVVEALRSLGTLFLAAAELIQPNDSKES